MLRKFVWTLVMLSSSWASAAMGAEDLRVLPADPPPQKLLAEYLRGEALAAIARRNAAYDQLKTPEDIAAYQTRMREFFVAQLGGFPERTPLNVRELGTIERDGYRMEKLIYESRPGFYVSAVLFLPADAKPPYPGVLVPCGHTPNGKLGYLKICVLLARNGIAALCYDPIGQGERYQVLDAQGKPRFKSTTEHTVVGVGSILVGRNTASYRVWDGMRGLDYLASRKEIDPARLGCTGSSGGGTLTEYLMSLDPRVACAAPSCCINTFESRARKNGPGDAEQNIFGQVAFGMDHAEYAIMRAPRPLLFCSATRDFVDIQGGWHIFRETKRIYSRLGFSERVDLVENDGEHGFVTEQRVAVARWMRRWLLGIDDAVVEPDLVMPTEEEVRCTPRGQTLLLAGARSVLDINRQHCDDLLAHRQKMWEPANRAAALAEVARVAGIRPLVDLPRPQVEKTGRLDRDGYHIEKLVLHRFEGIPVPGLLFVPDRPNGQRHLYLHGQGKQVDAGPQGPIEELARAGSIVLAIDLPGTGETGSGGDGLMGVGHYEFFFSYLLGRSLLGRRAEAVEVAARFLAEREASAGGSPSAIQLTAIGAAGPPALHAAALEPALFEKVNLEESLTSWVPVVSAPVPTGQLVNAVHGALEHYDLTNLAASLGPKKLTVRKPIESLEGN